MNIPVITKNLLIINFLLFIAFKVLGGIGMVNLNDLLGLHFFMASDFKIFQLMTYMFMHAGFEHIFFNMFALWLFGRILERVWGTRRYLTYYLVCGVGAGLIQEVTQFFQIYHQINSQTGLGLSQSWEMMAANAGAFNEMTTVGASGAVYALLLAFGVLFPNERIFVFPLPIPIKVKWMVIFYAGIELFSAFSVNQDNIAHLSHLGGMLFGLIMIRYWRRHDRVTIGGAGRMRMTQEGFKEFFERARNAAHHHEAQTYTEYEEVREETDYEYNARKKAEQDEIDAILDKIKKSGYESLSPTEKQKLFDHSKNA